MNTFYLHLKIQASHGVVDYFPLVRRLRRNLELSSFAFQVTRLTCGGFILALRFNHSMTDGAAIVQFLNAIAEIAQGANEPSITPLWCRELLSARNPPRITCTHREYEEVPHTKGTIISPNDLQQRSLFFGHAEIATIRRRFVPHHLGPYTSFEIIAACLWRCRTIALQMDPNQEVRMMVLVNGRAKFNPPIPNGYYGSVFGFPAALTTAGKLCGNPLTYALELVKKAKAEVSGLGNEIEEENVVNEGN
ncbi:hypothetical protein L6164_005511 [Bauhinia variegata]|uniref:Uncharacterized protein n=2 Tax=Bauhinia variegata TaxID=167791 RepID=A0ACB9PTE1_BAUVA|nr:hypothetical protein L6164_005508 [Bauhinia variegata]KAI4351127.1 hypothetical protein L6164_005511 [Bauhinia variegata]